MKEFLKAFSEFQKFASRRGLQLIEAIGTKWKLYETPMKFEITEEGIDMTFEENTRHDCPDYESISLTIAELEMNDQDWTNYLDAKHQESARKAQEAAIKAENLEQEEKLRQFNKLKAELGM